MCRCISWEQTTIPGKRFRRGSLLARDARAFLLSCVGEPVKLARALLTIAGEKTPPRRFIAGADAVATAEQVAADLKAQTDAYRDLSTSLAFESA